MHKLFLCRHCENVSALIEDHGVPLFCCGEKMQALTTQSAQGAGEKHIPLFCRQQGRVVVQVGENHHPMTQEHLISFVVLETDKGIQYRALSASCQPKAEFAILPEEKIVNVYAYCNRHGLWEGKEVNNVAD